MSGTADRNLALGNTVLGNKVLVGKASRDKAGVDKAGVGKVGDAALAPAARLGGELRARRQSLGWELPELAQSLRIRLPYLEAIEGGRMGELPGPTYALGFVRAYAEALGLPGEQMASRFRAETGETSNRPALSFPAPVPQRGVPAGALMLLGLVILAGAYSGWYYMSEHQRTPAETVPPIPDRLRPAAAAPQPSPQVASLLPTASAPAPQPPAPAALAHPPLAAGGQVAPVQTAPVQTAPAPGVNAPGPAAQAVLPKAPASSPATPPAVPFLGQPAQPASPQTAPVQAAPAPAAVPPVSAVPAGTRIVLKANADAWITVRQPGAAPNFSRLMHAGDTWPVPADKPGLLLTTGNAGGTELDVDGTPIPTLGADGAVRRDLKLDADALKAGPLPPIGRARRAVPPDQG